MELTFKSTLKHIALAVSGCFLATGCVSIPDPESYRQYFVPTMTKQALIETDNFGGFLVSTTEYCSSAVIKYKEIGKKLERKENITSNSFAVQDGQNRYSLPRTPVVIAVPPGAYNITGIECRIDNPNGYRIIKHDALKLWLKPFFVKAGEVLYTGTISSSPYKREYGREISGLETWFTGTPGRRSQTYAGYSVSDLGDSVKAELEKLAPNLAKRFKANVREPILEVSEVRKIIDAAYNQYGDSDYVPKTRAEALQYKADADEYATNAFAKYVRTNYTAFLAEWRKEVTTNIQKRFGLTDDQMDTLKTLSEKRKLEEEDKDQSLFEGNASGKQGEKTT